jgi:hypothetical protein
MEQTKERKIMKMRSYGKTILYAVGFLFLAALAIAQAPATSKTVKPHDTASSQATGRDAASGQATGRKSGAINAADFKNTDRQLSGHVDQFPKASGAVAETPSGQSAALPSLNAKDSAHATESLEGALSSGTGKAAKTSSEASNAVYKENGTTGENPLYQGKDKTAATTSTGHETVEYKDGEDGTMRYRPGNNKTTKTRDKSKGTATPPSR